MSSWITVLVNLFGGLGIFFLGMQLMSDGLQKAAGERMRRILELFTSRPFTAVLTGAGVTAVLQSSSTVTVMIVGFVNSGLMNLTQALGTIMGSNIGTTITAQIVSFDIYVLAFPLIGVGALLYFFSKKRFLRYLGKVLLGFGLLLLGLSTMSSAVDPLKTYQPFLDLLVLFGQRPLLGILAGAVFTAIVQSSSATTGLVIALAWQGIVDLPAGLAIAVGANIGTCITAVLAGTTAGTSARRAAIGHVLFNVFGTVLFVILRRPFVSLVGATGASVARQLANAHTLFNVFTTLLVFPFLKHFVRLVTVLVPGRDEVIELKPKFLDDRIVETPGALFAANQEVLRMINLAVDMVEQAISAFIKGDKSLLHQIEQREQVVNTLEKAITAYLAKTNQSSMNVEQAREVINLMHIVNDVERIGDHAINIAELAEARTDGNLDLSEAAVEDLNNMSGEVMKMCRGVIEALTEDNSEQARGIVALDDLVDDLEKRYRANHIQRLNEGVCDPEIGVLFLDTISNLERVADHATNIAEAVADIAFSR
ncbi:MAG TPA: Na/Pi cotransporter family protein [Firmicutes bacterium]|jgi:phosphate:Na+ symporter|nr:Na/Pi cotransporter family protein [Bacillota bacterium]